MDELTVPPAHPSTSPGCLLAKNRLNPRHTWRERLATLVLGDSCCMVVPYAISNDLKRRARKVRQEGWALALP